MPFLNVYVRVTLVLFGFILGVVSYTVSVCKLVNLLEHFNGKDFKKEVKDIRVQSLGFYLSALLYFVFFIA